MKTDAKYKLSDSRDLCIIEMKPARCAALYNKLKAEKTRDLYLHGDAESNLIIGFRVGGFFFLHDDVSFSYVVPGI